jgi:uncharacterized protein YjbJ (UPF0337 family)
MKGTIKEKVGSLTRNRVLKAEGKAEKKAGQLQQRIGRAKEAVANLKGQLTKLRRVQNSAKLQGRRKSGAVSR